MQPSKKQSSIKAGLKKLANCGNDAVIKELTKFHTLNCFKPCDTTSLSRDVWHNVPTSLMFLTKKYSGGMKARACANGSTQCQCIAQEEATAPMVTTGMIFIQVTIFAHKCCNVATCDIPGTFLQADNPDYILIRLGN
jgi:hypothetical protein